jgi:N-acetylated-alpha-linked acidic dipeptidase
MGNQNGLIKRWIPILCGFLSTAYSVPLHSAEGKPLIGFTPDSASREHTLEAQFDSSLAKNNLRDWMQHLTARPHHLGSAFDKENAEFIAEKFRSWGYVTTIEQFEVLFPTPKVRVVQMIAPTKFTAVLSEPALKEDATSGQISEQLPVYHAYSIDGDVTAEIVYVNFGIPKDYETLAENGIDVKGKIVLARYGGSWRGIKPKVAAEHGAIGCLIYSDPHEDGFFQGDVYPKDAWRNETGAQRGSVADMPLYPGDPLTPGVGATQDAHRLPMNEAATLTKIPVLPLSHSDALPLLKALEGPVVPEDWRGALPLTYHFGPGPTRVHLKVEFDWKQVPLFDVIAKVQGSERPDEWVIRGNHHDAWVNGASDPTSGMVVVMEEARAMSELLKTGWKPKRTIIFAAWDGEEPGLLGSTEWVETHGDELQKHAAIYINSDGNGRGFLNAGGSHSLEKFVNEIARDVQDPQKRISVADRAKALALVKGNPESKKEARDRADFRIYALGSGSDYTPFLQHNGIASLNLGFGGEDNGGVYHSIYDSFDHFTRFVDPKFEYGIALAQTAGRAVLRSANADVLPFEFKNLTDSLDKYFHEIAKLTDEMREETKQKNQLIVDKSFEAVADPAKTFIVPAVKDPVPFLNFAPLQNALAQLRESAANFDKLRNEVASGKRTLTLDQQRALDAMLLNSERTLIRNEGLPRRPWFKHQIYAPGFYTGYGVKTLPAVREAIEQRDWKEAEEQVPIVAKVIEHLAEEVGRAAKIVN